MDQDFSNGDKRANQKESCTILKLTSYVHQDTIKSEKQPMGIQQKVHI